MEPTVTRVACVQLAPVLGDLAGNIERARAAVRAAVADGARIVVLPELATSGYLFATADEARAAAVAAGDPRLAAWADDAARGEALVIAGFCELGEDGRLYNSAIALDGSGTRAVYRKTHLWDREKEFFTPGRADPPVIATPYGRVGILICYDLEFPEMPRSLALRGADLVAVPTNWPVVPRPDGEHPPEVVAAMAAARASRVFVACCDRSGTERGERWTRGTALIDTDGWIRASTRDEGGRATADLRLGDARGKRLTELADVLADRRPELYGPLTDR
ncbi:nitrilase-related carbon-nitrogen hydrolase [Actinomadura fibrosa]|uniref:Nitrilase-related carbon-nitrogen hydrolase n=1 Tax=Actinomadura fibrosa TaxID=111802 RepID=A0ABW2XYB3_9ACTN|nr:nitrilase-related carbon-nitrogen hydrolase [Actinomadura fibrosa]